MANRQNKHEASKHAIAFEYYYALGADRSYAEVGKRIGVSGNSVGLWSLSFRWEERIAQRDKLVSELLAQKAVEDEAQSKANALKICRAVQMRFAEALELGKVNIETGDFEKAVKLELLLRGRADSRSEVIMGPTFDKLIDMLAAVIEREVADPVLRGRLAMGFTEAASVVLALPAPDQTGIQ